MVKNYKKVKFMKRTVIIAGAGPGLGNHVAEKFGSMGFRVILLARRKEALKQYQRELEQKGIETAWYATDVSNTENVRETFRAIYEKYGVADVVVYNVGVTTPDKDTNIDTDVLEARYKTDVAGAYSCIREIATEEFAKKNGAILITGGKLATQPEFTFLPLSMDKAALRAMVYAMHPVLKEKGIYIGMVTVAGGIRPETHFAPELIAERFWELYEKRELIEMIYE